MKIKKLNFLNRTSHALVYEVTFEIKTGLFKKIKEQVIKVYIPFIANKYFASLAQRVDNGEYIGSLTFSSHLALMIKHDYENS